MSLHNWRLSMDTGTFHGRITIFFINFDCLDSYNLDLLLACYLARPNSTGKCWNHFPAFIFIGVS